MKKAMSVLMVMLLVFSLHSGVCFGEKDVFYIDNENEFINFSESVDEGSRYDGCVIRLNSDLNFAKLGINLRPIGSKKTPFCGTFDGNNRVITLNMDRQDSSQIGLFGCTNGAVIANLTIKGCVYGNISVGAFVGSASNTRVINCRNEAEIMGFCSVGGIVGYAIEGVELYNCVNCGDVFGFTKQGPFFGSMNDSNTVKCISCRNLRR